MFMGRAAVAGRSSIALICVENADGASVREKEKAAGESGRDRTRLGQNFRPGELNFQQSHGAA
jgi:hypothetical protein